MKISDIIAIIGGFVSLSFYGYLTFCLDYMEKKLLPIKTKAYLFLSTFGITLLAIILLLVTAIIEDSTVIRVIIIIVIAIYCIISICFLFQSFKDSKRKNICFEYNSKTYKLLNRIDDTFISALPISTSNSDNEVYLIPLAKLDDNKFYVSKKQQPQRNNQNQLNDIIKKLNEIINLLKKND